MRIQPGQTHQMGVSRTQDDAMVGYVFQRPTEPEFNTQSSTFQAKQAPRAWALADDVIVDNNQEKWKYSMTKLGVPQQSQSQQLGLTMNNVHLSNVPYEIHPMQLKSGAPGAEHLVYLNNQMTAQQQVALFHHQQQQQQQQFRNGQIAPSTKKALGRGRGRLQGRRGCKRWWDPASPGRPPDHVARFHLEHDVRSCSVATNFNGYGQTCGSWNGISPSSVRSWDSAQS